jgi:hypothetical protein
MLEIYESHVKKNSERLQKKRTTFTRFNIPEPRYVVELAYKNLSEVESKIIEFREQENEERMKRKVAEKERELKEENLTRDK